MSCGGNILQQQKKDFNFKIAAHPTLLSNQISDVVRELDIYFGIPSNGINDETGIILLIAGFGGHADSNVYKKIRSVFADTYNLVTIQCDYLGCEFMQTPKPEEVQKLVLSAIQKSPPGVKIINVKNVLNETPDNYVDMGPIQAIDCLSAVFAVKAVLEDNGHCINWGRSIAYGHSHGAYLAHLCNLFAPGLFNLLIDNSAWLNPAYLHSDRAVSYTAGNKTVQFIYDYLIKKAVALDKHLFHLPYLYNQLGTNCALIIYQGITDNLVNHHDKKNFANSIKNAKFNLITKADANGGVFGSTDHGLKSDHLKLFSLAYDSYRLNFPCYKQITFGEVRLKTEKAEYSIDYTHGLPVFTQV